MTMIWVPMPFLHGSQFSVRQPKFEKTFSASMLNATIYGIAMTMALQYYRYHSKGDTTLVKGFVALLLISGSFEVVCTSYQMYDYFILNFGRKELFDVITGVALARILLIDDYMKINNVQGKYLGIYFTAFVAQLFYASRIWSVTGHLTRKFRYLTYPVLVLDSSYLQWGVKYCLKQAKYQ
ncbi:hypothetical protein BDQ17DRAFT_1329471 [Cyathus striatus]|nr:hypothetical protein BDQ17DRAFT_1329471 [Cyathus striatus]